MSTAPSTGDYIGLPSALPSAITETKHFFQALDNFTRTFAFRPGDRVLMLADPLLDPRVMDAVQGHARARGATVRVYMEPNSRVTEVPQECKAMVEAATFVVSTWFCSIIDPYFIAMRKRGQRWVKITYFRNLDLLHTEQARFPIELIGEITRATARRYPQGVPFDLRFTDQRGSDFKISFTPTMRDNMLATNRWRGKTTADEDGCYVHYLASHGPNLWDHNAVKNDLTQTTQMSGVLYPQWAVGFRAPFAERIGVHFDGEYVSRVEGESSDAALLREMLVGGRMIEGGGCGFNPKAPRHTIYPAGSNSPGALHFGIDLVKPADYIRRTMPDWEEPPVHVDLVTLDATVTAGDNMLVESGFLCALRDPEVVRLAQRYGDPLDLLEAQVL
ncbi:hypothetical protein [Variovorax sp. J31P207]|uniref:hypothetical protein n=1 Tax=Variovorax sp. J31P207 TaxID=3053510 RepID=UPI0025764DF8|nr:hypothetical protein [Variovorax sp. J31P207]MDM0066909.1 hypothetical protein [Variovorax sp. J31P207]